MTAHIIVHPNTELEQLNQIKKNIKHELEHVNIQHATLEFETESENCTDTNSI
jgi:cobalt-zinc-cadmium efflux system protein